MVLTKSELIASMQHEVHVLLHLAGKIDRALLQYNSSSHSVSANVRLRWEYRPGSEFFVVYNEDRDTLARRFPQLSGRALILKINRLFRP